MNKPKFKLSCSWSCNFRVLPYFIKEDLRWKDKYESPRCEKEPYFKVEWLWFGLHGVWGDDQYWEQWLWVNKYCGGDETKAKETWGWVDSETKQSTWKEY